MVWGLANHRSLHFHHSIGRSKSWSQPLPSHVGFRPATIRAAERWRSVKVTEFERRQMAAARKRIDDGWLMKARHGPPHVGTMIWASRAALGAGGRTGAKG